MNEQIRMVGRVKVESKKKKIQVSVDSNVITEFEAKRGDATVSDFGEQLITERLFSIKIWGYVCAGDGMETIPFDPPLYRPVTTSYPDDYYGLVVVGNSMDGGGRIVIKDGDTLIFKPCASPTNGETVHAQWSDGLYTQATVKRWYKDEKTGRVVLKPTNETYVDIAFDPKDQKAEVFQPIGCFVAKL